MKLIFGFIAGILLYCYSPAQSPGNITDINRHSVSLDSLNGKKMLIILLPLQQDTAIINQLIRFQKKYEQQVKIIALVYRDNSNPGADGVRNIYGAIADAGIVVSEGMQAGDSATTQREGVLQWLSAKNRNRQAEPFAAGSKYFLSESGRLFAQIGKNTPLDNRLVDNIVKINVPAEAISPKDSIIKPKKKN